MDPYQQQQRRVECIPQIREMMAALGSEVQEYGGWEKITSGWEVGKLLQGLMMFRQQ